MSDYYVIRAKNCIRRDALASSHREVFEFEVIGEVELSPIVTLYSILSY